MAGVHKAFLLLHIQAQWLSQEKATVQLLELQYKPVAFFIFFTIWTWRQTMVILTWIPGRHFLRGEQSENGISRKTEQYL